MEKKIFIVRHCRAQGQSPKAQLTEEGLDQAILLSRFFLNTNIDRIISSPFLRAIQSVEPLSDERNIKIEIEERLAERTLSTRYLTDWIEKLEATFTDLELKYEGGESSKEAMSRIVSVVDEVFKSTSENTILVTHGNIMSLLLKNYDNNFGFDCWKRLSNPDVYVLSYSNNQVTMERKWSEEL
ncbi:histidine phosphatase family protein [Pseudogracilibacillus sp. SE30717A]|uniref:histidine phosphatase family protein n=1 Tax=Pseudogracilibacillus sp. SE30717A TaxID=3098293 RepID=UPI00300E5785